MMLWFNQYSVAIQAISVIALVLVTIFYAWQTRNTVIQIKEQKNYGILPIVIPEAFSISNTHKSSTMCVEAVLKNIGQGPAKQILVKFYDEDTDELISSSVHYLDILKQDEQITVHVHIPKTEFSSIRYKDYNGRDVADITVKIEFNDFGNNGFIVSKGFVLERKTQVMEPVEGTFEFDHKE